MLQQIFFLVGTIYFVISLLLLLVVVGGVFFLLLKLKQLRQDIPQKLAPAFIVTGLVKRTRLSRYLPLLALVPVILKAIDEFKAKKSA